MKVLIAGANGNTAKRIVRLLVEDGHEVRAMVRDEEQAPQLEQMGAESIVADLEGEIDHTAEGCDAIIFAAGAGPGSGAAKKETVDRQGAEKLVEAAEKHGVGRYLMLSAMGASDPESGSEGMQPYLFAKAAADERLASSNLDYTIIRPGSLTDEDSTGRIEAAQSLGRRGEISREDVASTFVAALGAGNTYGKTFEILAGETPIQDAIEVI